jgi:hypothetical protein
MKLLYLTPLIFFFSVFNPDAIKDLKLYKGGIPANFAFLLFWTFTKRREQQRIPHEWRHRVNFQQTITGRSTKRQRFVLTGGSGGLFLKLSEEQKIILSIFMI